MWEFDDAVDVHSVVVDGIDTPDQFLWRGRLWRVCSIESHWSETAAWWERGLIGTGRTSDRHTDHLTHDALLAPACSVPDEPCAPAGTTAAGMTACVAEAPAMSVSPAAVGVLDADWGPRRAVFRVEAGCGRHGRRELFDLAHDPDSGRWQLERVTNR